MAEVGCVSRAELGREGGSELHCAQQGPVPSSWKRGCCGRHWEHSWQCREGWGLAGPVPMAWQQLIPAG